MCCCALADAFRASLEAANAALAGGGDALSYDGAGGMGGASGGSVGYQPNHGRSMADILNDRFKSHDGSTTFSRRADFGQVWAAVV